MRCTRQKSVHNQCSGSTEKQDDFLVNRARNHRKKAAMNDHISNNRKSRNFAVLRRTGET